MHSGLLMADTMCPCQPQRNPYAVDRTLTKEPLSKPSGQAPSEQVVQEDCLGAKAFGWPSRGSSRDIPELRTTTEDSLIVDLQNVSIPNCVS